MNNLIYKSGIVLALILTSCVSTKEVLYFQDAQNMSEKIANQSYESSIQSDDILSITITSSDPVAVQPFNKVFPTGANVTFLDKGYLVDINGDIVLPIIGRIEAAGLTNIELADVVKKKLVDGGYILDPSVSVSQLNFKYSVLGEVKNPGIYYASSERTTLLEALSRAGDMNIQGNRARVAVIREVDGKREIMYLDIRSKEFLESPYYYLSQNDIVYIEPSKRKINQSADRQWISLVFSGSSVLLSMFALLFK